MNNLNNINEYNGTIIYLYFTNKDVNTINKTINFNKSYKASYYDALYDLYIES